MFNNVTHALLLGSPNTAPHLRIVQVLCPKGVRLSTCTTLGEWMEATEHLTNPTLLEGLIFDYAVCRGFEGVEGHSLVAEVVVQRLAVDTEIIILSDEELRAEAAHDAESLRGLGFPAQALTYSELVGPPLVSFFERVRSLGRNRGASSKKPALR